MATALDSAVSSRRPIRMKIPASVAFDLKAFNRSVAGLAERLGCKTCFSGHDCLLTMERQFVLDEKLDFISAPAGPSVGEIDPDGSPGRTVTVTMPVLASNELKRISEIIGKVAGRLGCSACCSGFDVFLRRQLSLQVDDAGNLH